MKITRTFCRNMAKLTTLNCPKCNKDFAMLHFCSKELSITYMAKSLSVIFTDLITNIETAYKFSVSKKKAQDKLNKVVNSYFKNLMFK